MLSCDGGTRATPDQMDSREPNQIVPHRGAEPALTTDGSLELVLTQEQRRRLYRFFAGAGVGLGTLLTMMGIVGGHTFLGPMAGLTIMGCGVQIGMGILTYIPSMLGVYRREYDRANQTITSIRLQLMGTSVEAPFDPSLEKIDDRVLLLCHEASRLTIAVRQTLGQAQARGKITLLNKALGSGKALFDHLTGQAALDTQSVAYQSYRVAVTREIDGLMVQVNRARGPQQRDLVERARELRRERDLFDERVARIQMLDQELDSLWRALDSLHEKSQQTRAAHQLMITGESRELIEDLHTELDDLKHALTEVSRIGNKNSAGP